MRVAGAKFGERGDSNKGVAINIIVKEELQMQGDRGLIAHTNWNAIKSGDKIISKRARRFRPRHEGFAKSDVDYRIIETPE